ncbi:TonB-dependent receptor [Mucilaginibacter sp. FT3.2]|uniref:TonB-dependent receptor n=1 Tax=Mucilaginibacter sp. FT3.2 TaxID=2723090 RepID=UPI00161C0EB8|nr:TonB-dependent receptor [Mucilaginibacter sp. FT3.2]MBB6229765.1 TonB-linked SusC/RagA family outer membrane protein [Mucilaginibacter sp. FT3.2]
MNFITCRISGGSSPAPYKARNPGNKYYQTWRIMKLTLILLTIAFMHVHASSYSQTVTYSGKNVALEKVFKSIRKQTGYVFFYSYDLLQKARPINLNVKNVPLEQALKDCFAGQSLDYAIENKTIVISVAKNQLSVPVPPVRITGKVTDTTGAPLPAATITIKGKAGVMVTGIDGTFAIDAQVGDVLVISYIGLTPKQITITASTTYLSIVLSPETGKLGEVVVVGYGTQNKKDLSTAVATVGSKALGRQVVSSFENALQGQAPGVQVNNPTGQPGSAINISIRGKNSLSLSTSPLYVIDGVPVQPGYDEELGIGNQRPNPLSTLATSDIESIDVLKDGAAAAIYGSRASNGVVVVTTKRGKAGKPQVDFNMYYGQQKLVKKIKLLNGKQFASVFNQSLVNAGEDPAYDVDTVTTNTNWQDLLYHDAPIRNYQLSVQGGNDKTKYYISGAYFNQDGIIRNSGFERYSVKINLDQQVTDKFKIGTSLSLANTKNNRSTRSEMQLNNSGVVLGALEQIPTLAIYNADGTYALNPFSQSDNPYGDNETTHNMIKMNQVFGNMYGEYNILKNLTFRSSIGIDYRAQIENQFIDRENPGFENAPSASRGSAATGTNTGTIWLWENTLTYKTTFKNDHNLTLLAGQSAQNSELFTSSAAGYGFPSNAVPYLYAASIKQSMSSYEEQWGLVSYFLRANYNYKDRYYASASMRADGSSRFAPNNRYGYFPAVSAAWRISQEPFFNKNSIISELKLRGSFGANGNQNVGVYDRYSTYGTGYNYSNYTGDGSVAGGIAAQRIGNDKLRWETTYQYDAGFDMDLFNSRVNITADVYLKRTKDLLTEVPLSISSGAEITTIVQNLGQVQNKGFELGINTVNIRSLNGFTWSTQFNFSLNRNKVLDLGKLVDENGKTVDRTIIGDYSISEKGQPLGAFYGYVVKGIFQTPAEVAAAPTQPNAAAGDLRFEDLNNDGVIDAKDRKVIGDPNPKFISGITNTFSYKGVDLSFFFQGSFGNQIYNQNRTLLENMVNPFNQSVDVLNSWTHAGQKTNLPREVYGDPNGNSTFSTQYLESGTYVRLKNLTLGYTFPVSLIKKVGISSLRIFATGQNILTFTRYKGYDPEVNADPLSNTGFGRDYGVYPPAKTYTLGINVQF